MAIYNHGIHWPFKGFYPISQKMVNPTINFGVSKFFPNNLSHGFVRINFVVIVCYELFHFDKRSCEEVQLRP